MTPEENNKTLGILHIVYGALHAFLVLVMALIFIPVMIGAGASGKEGDAAGAAILAGLFAVFGFIMLILSMPSIVAGYGMLKRKSWAKIWAMIAGGIAGMSFPLGTALCVYTFWFIFSGGGKELYEKSSARWGTGQPGVLHGAPEPAQWATRNREREYAYTPPPEPPNWRGE